MEAEGLLPANVANIPDAQGVYQLLLGDQYCLHWQDRRGGRPSQAARTSRPHDPAPPGTTPAEVISGVRVFAVHRRRSRNPTLATMVGIKKAPWNLSGFGANDPGRERDTTNISPEGFDALLSHRSRPHCAGRASRHREGRGYHHAAQAFPSVYLSRRTRRAVACRPCTPTLRVPTSFPRWSHNHENCHPSDRSGFTGWLASDCACSRHYVSRKSRVSLWRSNRAIVTVEVRLTATKG